MYIQVLGVLLCVIAPHPKLYLTLVWWLMLAPPPSNTLTTSLWPLPDDTVSGVSPPSYTWQREKTYARSCILSSSAHVRPLQSTLHPSPTLTTIFPSIPLSVVPDLPLPGLTVSPPHCDHRLMHCRLLLCPAVCVVEEHSFEATNLLLYRWDT